MAKKNYSEKEVAQIFKRAAELESKQSEQFNTIEGGPGLSLDELSQIATDAGLDPENVLRAAEELSPSTQPGSKTGHQTASVKDNEVIAEQWVSGDLTDDQLDLIISDLNHRYNASHEKVNWMDNILHDATLDANQKSTVKRTGKSLEWKTAIEYGSEEIRVLVQPRGDKIRIRVAKRNVYGNTFEETDSVGGFLPYIPYLAGIIMLFALPNSLLINAGFAVLTFFICQILISRNSEWIRKKFSDSKKNTLEKYQNEVQTVARDLAGLLGQPQKRSQVDDVSEKETSSASLGDIEIEDAKDEIDRESNSATSRNRDRS